ncbi:hypothetical protein KZX46_03480 (plasmid) [Polymorphobacter sp. PAMC 29334]|uniref:hypothetical protein n=1 Tax=Polymorphobacter sp. PAMC 29334 TaxID=2862331 RepID=UPI001C748180|nr:hypothetical protein [Polymorphobacter sp. PAMC 29334]QYE33185.1 hypothetical protein KZX46_03480 [Polymorphobacter sp. PAMC 29334]
MTPTYTLQAFTAHSAAILFQLQNHGIPNSISSADVTVLLGDASIVDVSLGVP